jgi:hypothetical protein
VASKEKDGIEATELAAAALGDSGWAPTSPRVPGVFQKIDRRREGDP